MPFFRNGQATNASHSTFNDIQGSQNNAHYVSGHNYQGPVYEGDNYNDKIIGGNVGGRNNTNNVNNFDRNYPASEVNDVEVLRAKLAEVRAKTAVKRAREERNRAIAELAAAEADLAELDD